VSSDIDFDNLGIFGIRKILKRQSAIRTGSFVFGQAQDFRFRVQMRIVPSTVTRASALLSFRPFVTVGFFGFGFSGTFFGLSAVKLSFSKPELGFQFGFLLLEPGLSFDGLGVHRAPVTLFVVQYQNFTTKRTIVAPLPIMRIQLD